MNTQEVGGNCQEYQVVSRVKKLSAEIISTWTFANVDTDFL